MKRFILLGNDAVRQYVYFCSIEKTISLYAHTAQNQTYKAHHHFQINLPTL